jgi:hypothetical protein
MGELHTMNELGQGFFVGLFTMYIIGIPLILSMVEPEDEEADPRGPLKFAFLWPYVAMYVIYDIFIGENNNDDGTGST